MPVPTCNSRDATGTLQALRERGVVVWQDLPGRGAAGVSDCLAALSAVGNIVQTEEIRLRPGAHAYVAKPGPVPLHTDHPDVDVIAWHCEAQDPFDGANLLLDTLPVRQALAAEARALLHSAMLFCPPLSNGPPTELRPVLRLHQAAERIFLPPWIRLAEGADGTEAALAALVAAISAATATERLSLRLGPGDTLLIDNGRVLHGRGAIGEQSPRRLHRAWLQLRG